MATFSGSLNYSYYLAPAATPGANETGMQPAVCSGIGFGANPALKSSPVPAIPGAPATIQTKAIGGAPLTLTRET